MINFRALVLTVGFALVSVAQFVPGLGVGDARAAVDTKTCVNGWVNGVSGAQCDPEQAWAAATAYAEQLIAQEGRCQPGAYASVSGTSFDGSAYGNKSSGSAVGTPRNSSGCSYVGGFRQRNYAKLCPTGSTWNSTTKKCFSSAACLAKPATRLGILNLDLVPSKATCDSGCEFVAQGGTTSAYTTGGGQSGNWYVGGQWKPSGSACAAGQGNLPAPSSIPSQQCTTDSASGVPLCIKADTGEHCVKFQDGRQSCWKPFESGEKTDGSKLQVRNAGALPTTPQTPPPPGDTFAQSGSPLTASTTNTDPQGAVRSATMTTTNYSTVGGSDAGSQDQGEPGDGSGSGSTATGSSDTERNSLLGSIKDGISSLLDGLKGDGVDHSADGAQPGDTNVWSEDETVDATALDQSGMTGGEGMCPPVWDTPSEGGMASAFLIAPPQEWCDFVSNLRTILILFAVGAGIALIWKN